MTLTLWTASFVIMFAAWLLSQRSLRRVLRANADLLSANAHLIKVNEGLMATNQHLIATNAKLILVNDGLMRERANPSVV